MVQRTVLYTSQAIKKKLGNAFKHPEVRWLTAENCRSFGLRYTATGK